MNNSSNRPETLRYVPIGTRYSRDEIGNLSLADLTERSIYDPRYAGFEAGFNWRDYLTVHIRNPELRGQTEAAFDQLSRTPEGQHLVRQAFAMQVFRNTGEVLEPPFDAATHQRHRIDIRNREGGNGFSLNGVLQLNRTQMESYEYRGMEGDFHDMTLQRLLVHELCHAADGLLTNTQMDHFDATHARPLLAAREAFMQPHLDKMRYPSPEEYDAFYQRTAEQRSLYFAGPMEFPAIRLTNEVMGRYFNEAPRVLDHNIATGARLDPRREGTFFHTDIQYTPTANDDIVAPRTPEQPGTKRAIGPEI